MWSTEIHNYSTISEDLLKMEKTLAENTWKLFLRILIYFNL